jgi:hypothetical protein
MKTLCSGFVVVLLSFGFVVNSVGQGLPAQVSEDYDVPLVKRALNEQAQGASFSFTNKYVSRLGDRVSIALLKIFDEKDFQNPKQLRVALKLVHQSFASLDLIIVPDDKNPKVTLFFLSCLQRQTKDPQLRDEISQLISFLNDKRSHQLGK